MNTWSRISYETQYSNKSYRWNGPYSYNDIVNDYYKTLKNLLNYQSIFIPQLLIAEEKQASRLKEYVRKGGTLFKP